MPTLLLVGHGSAHDPASGAPVRAHAARLRARGYDVRVAFWKEEPHLCSALATSADPEMVVVPIFMSEGYFTRVVVPRELGLTGTHTQRAGTHITYCRPVGTHPRMADVVHERVLAALPADVHRSTVAVVVAGHGTDRSATSALSTFAVVRQLRARAGFGLVACGFLDQAPHLHEVIPKDSMHCTVVVPFFVSEGAHTRISIPGAVERSGVDGARVVYAEAVGTAHHVADIALEIARAATSIEPVPAVA